MKWKGKNDARRIYSNDVSVNKMSKTTAIKTGKSYIYTKGGEKKNSTKINPYEKRKKERN